MSDTPTFTVTDINRQVKGFLESGLGTLAVIGEISNLTKHGSGHWYFTLKDQSAQLRCVHFRQYHLPTHHTFTHGTQVIATGKLSLYEARGDYQLIVHHLEEAGVGELYRQFELLKQKLQSQGIFDTQHKKPIPTFPTCIGLITSQNAAAKKDILTTLAQRYPLADIVLYHSEVQGVDAPLQLCKAIQNACQEQKADVLIVARGGGSMEDLWAFNDERLAHCIFESTLPIITGVGHETDFTIADFVADLRAATPTAAAVAATPSQWELLERLQSIEAKLRTSLSRLFEQNANKLIYLQHRLKSPAPLFEKQTQTLDYLTQRLENNMKQLLTQQQNKMALLMQSLHHISPLNTLERGYAIASQEGRVLKDPQEVLATAPIQLALAKGQLTCMLHQATTSSPAPHQ